MRRYVREDDSLHFEADRKKAIVRVIRDGKTRWKGVWKRSVLDAAAEGRDRALRAALQPLAPLFESTRVDEDDPAIRRVTISVSDRRWARIDWEAFAPPGACIVRISAVRPRVLQIPFSFPIRVLESRGKPVVADALRASFYDSDRSAAIIDAVAPPGKLARFPVDQGWPTVEVLHLREVAFDDAFVRSMQQMTEQFQTRLLILETTESTRHAARGAAQTIVERSGPAVWLVGSTFDKWWLLYAYLVHDRPLDWMRAQLSVGELFAGAGREEALRYSQLAESLASGDAIREIAEQVSLRPQGVVESAATSPTRGQVSRIVRDFLNDLGYPNATEASDFMSDIPTTRSHGERGRP